MSEQFTEEQLEIWKLDRIRDQAEDSLKDISIVDETFREEVGRRKRLLNRLIQSTRDRKEEILLNTSLIGAADVMPSPEVMEVLKHPTRGLTHAL